MRSHSANGIRGVMEPCSLDSQTCVLLLSLYCWGRYSGRLMTFQGHTREPMGLSKSTSTLFPLGCGKNSFSTTIVSILTKCLYFHSSAATPWNAHIIQLLPKVISCFTIASIKLVNHNSETITSAMSSLISYLT